MNSFYKTSLFFLFLFFTSFVSNSQSGNGLNFDGIDDDVDLNMALFSTTNGNQPYTLEAWVKTSVGDDDCIICQYNYPGTLRFQLGIRNNKLEWWKGISPNSASTTISIQSSQNVTTSEWIHVAGSRDELGVVTLYINGCKDGQGVDDLAFINYNVSLGERISSSLGQFQGDLDEVRIWNEVRTCSQIKANMHNELVGDEPNLIAYYNFNQGTPGGNNTGLTNLVDLSPNINNGTLQDFALNGSSSNWVLATNSDTMPNPNDTTTFNFQSCDPADVGTVSNVFLDRCGCDSVVILRTSLLVSDSTYLFNSSCQPADTGLVLQNLINQEGCDSVVIAQTNLIGVDSTFVQLSSCHQEDTGLVIQNIITQDGCDSIIIVETTYSLSDSVFIKFTSCDPLDTGLIVQNFINQFGCDSVAVIRTMFSSSDSTIIDCSSCNPMDTGIVVDQFMGASGCDSFIIKVTVLAALDTTSLVQVTCNPLDTGSRIEVFETSEGCDSFLVISTFLRNCPANIYIPTSFSPNNDGINDYFTIYANEIVGVDFIRIYDRWGSKLYELSGSSNREIRWDGTKNGKALNQETYAYVIQLNDGRIFKGDVILLR